MEQRTYKTAEQAAAQLGQLYRRYGYTPYKMNQFEEYELYVGNKDFLLYYKESVFRDYRELLQTGLECVGDLAEYEIAEVVLLAAKSLQLLGGRFVLNLSHMGLVAQILKGSGLTGAQQRQAADCLRQKNRHDLASLCADSCCKPGWNAWGIWQSMRLPRWCCWRPRACSCWGDTMC